MSTEESRPEIGPSGRKIIYDKDGKPCRSCNTLLDFKSFTGGSIKPSAITTATAIDPTTTSATTLKPSQQLNTNGYEKLDPPDVNELGKSTWTFLHSLAATYPKSATNQEQSNMLQFLNIFSKIYPCWFCAKDFEQYIEKTKPKVQTQEEFGKWLCDAHNEVNVKLGKPKFNCNLWKQRWKDGWDEEN